MGIKYNRAPKRRKSLIFFTLAVKPAPLLFKDVKMKHFCAILSLSSLLLASCGSSDDNKTTDISSANSSSSSSLAISSNASNSSSANSSASAVTTSSAATSSSSATTTSELTGVWFKDCNEQDPFDTDTLYETVKLIFTSTTFESDIHNYTDSDCTIPFANSPNPKARGNYTIGASFTSGDGLTVKEINTYITDFNGAPFDVTDYNIFYINGDELTLGDDAETAAERPTLLNFDATFIKQ